MSAESHKHLPDRSKKSFRERTKAAGALLTASAALAGGLPATAYANKAPKPSRERIIPPPLRKMNQLPGYNIRLSPEILNQLQSSSVEIGLRLKPEDGGSPDNPWQPWCSAVKVSLPGQTEPFITSSGHCFADLTGSKSGVFKNPLAPQDKAENYIALSPYEFAVLDISADLATRKLNPIAIIDGISISTNNKDEALLHAVPLNDVTANGVRNFVDVPTLPMKLASKVKPGTPVALYGTPWSPAPERSFIAQATTGRYLGQAYFNTANLIGNTISPSQPSQFELVDIVGLTREGVGNNIDVNNCTPGDSGSMAELPDGSTFGNLSFHSDKNTPPFNLGWFEDQFNINLQKAGIVEICGYSAIRNSDIQDLLKGFTIPAPRVGGKGGDPSAPH